MKQLLTTAILCIFLLTSMGFINPGNKYWNCVCITHYHEYKQGAIVAIVEANSIDKAKKIFLNSITKDQGKIDPVTVGVFEIKENEILH